MCGSGVRYSPPRAIVAPFCGVQPEKFEVGDRVRFRSGGLGKINNLIMSHYGIERYGWGPFEVTMVDGESRSVEIAVEPEKKKWVPAVWLLPAAPALASEVIAA